jgi:hypothetical protein
VCTHESVEGRRGALEDQQCNLPLAEVRRLPHQQRIPYVHKVRVFHPDLQRLLAKIERCYTQQPYAAEPPCLMISGRTGAGKTTLAEIMIERHPTEWRPEGRYSPVVRAIVEVPARVKNLASTLLRALGDPLYEKGSTIEMAARIEHLCKNCGVRVIIIDEIHHFVDPDRKKVLNDVTNWLKTLIKDRTKVAFILIGLEDEAEQLLKANGQLLRLFGTPKLLPAFIWDEDKPKTINQFRALLCMIEDQLPLNEPSDLSNQEIAQRVFVASDGTLSYVMRLIRGATERALALERERIDVVILAEIFDDQLAGELRGIANPFRGPLPAVRKQRPPAKD